MAKNLENCIINTPNPHISITLPINKEGRK